MNIKFRRELGIFCAAVACASFFGWLHVAVMHKNNGGGFFSTHEAQAEAAWYNASWQYRRRIILNAGGPNNVATTTTVGAANFPTLISFSDTDLTGKMNVDCNDAVFTSSDGTTKLAHEVDSCVKSSGEFNAWVNSAMSSTTDTYIYMYYGGYGDQQNTKDTWESEYLGVWHMKAGTVASSTPTTTDVPGSLDSTANNNDVDFVQGLSSSNEINGRVGKAMTFDGTNDRADVYSEKAQFSLNKFTASAFGLRNGVGSIDEFFSNLDAAGDGFFLRVTNGVTDVFRCRYNTTATDGTTDILVSTWYHFACTSTGTSIGVFVNGVREGTGTVAGNILETTPAAIGGTSYSPTEDPFNGSIDEVRFENIQRDAMDVQTMYRNMAATTTFYTVGVEQQRVTKVRAGADPKAVASNWYNASWQYRQKITLIAGGPTAVATTTTVGIANFPTLISLSDTTLTALMNDGCDDVVFTQANGTTKLAHEIDSCSKTTGEFLAWVNTAMSSTTNTDIYMYYGGYGNQQDLNNTWEEEYIGVYHMNEDPSITTTGKCRNTQYNGCDSSGNRYHATSSGAMTATDLVGGRLGKGIDFDGTNDYFEANPIARGVVGTKTRTPVTMSLWANLTEDASSGEVLFSFNTAARGASFNAIEQTEVLRCAGSANTQGTTDIEGTGFHYLACVLNDTGNTVDVWVDGVREAQGTDTTTLSSSDLFSIAQEWDATASDFSDGVWDEVRVEGINRDAMDIQTMYRNMFATTTYYTVGAREGRRTKVRLGANPGTLSAGAAMSGGAWYNGSWQFRRKITLIAGGPTAVATTTTVGAANFPTLISFSNTSLTSLMDGGCTDVVFTQANGTTKLNHEIDSCVKSSGEFNAWVNTAMSSTTNTDIYMYYGGYGNQQERTKTWEEEYRGVWHLAEDPSISTDGFCRGPNNYTNCDSTSNINHASSTGAMPSTAQIGGRVNGALDFDGSDDSLDVSDHATLDFGDTDDLTISGWFNRDTFTTEDEIVTKKFDLANTGGYVVFIDDVTDDLQLVVADVVDNFVLDSVTTFVSTGWNHFATVWDESGTAGDTSDATEIYINGVDDNATDDGTAISLIGSLAQSFLLRIGQESDGGRFFDGKLDEIRLENIARHAMDIQTMYQNMNATTTYYTVGAQEGRRTKVRMR